MFHATTLEPEIKPSGYNFPVSTDLVTALLSNNYVKIGYASDLHLDFEDINEEFFEPVLDVLILAGDIHEVRTMNTQLNKFWRRCSDSFKHVLYIPGNHEYYHGAIPKADFDLQRDLSEFDNIHSLQNRTFDYRGVHFVGSTLWTDMNNGNPVTQMTVENYMNDFRLIRNSERDFAKFSTRDCIAQHIKSKQFISQDLSAHERSPVVVLTHHAPCSMSVTPRYRHLMHENYGYFSNLENILLGRVVPTWWIHGHVHFPFNYNVGQTNVRCNPRGYPGERPTSKPSPFEIGPYRPEIFTIDIPDKVSIH